MILISPRRRVMANVGCENTLNVLEGDDQQQDDSICSIWMTSFPNFVFLLLLRHHLRPPLSFLESFFFSLVGSSHCTLPIHLQSFHFPSSFEVELFFLSSSPRSCFAPPWDLSLPPRNHRWRCGHLHHHRGFDHHTARYRHRSGLLWVPS